MNELDKKIVQEMIEYVEERERQIQAAKLGKKTKPTAIKEIMDKLKEKTEK